MEKDMTVLLGDLRSDIVFVGLATVALVNSDYRGFGSNDNNHWVISALG